MSGFFTEQCPRCAMITSISIPFHIVAMAVRFLLDMRAFRANARNLMARGLRSLLLASILVLHTHVAGATTIDVNIGTLGFQGQPGVFAFDFIDGGTPANSLILSTLLTDGQIGGSSTTGAVTGTGPWSFVDTDFFNELLVSFLQLGSFTAFTFDTTDLAPDPASLPDTFSVFLLDPVAQLSLVETSDPTGANALFLYEIGRGLTVYQAIAGGVTVEATVRGEVPEPSTLPLMVLGSLYMWLRRQRSR